MANHASTRLARRTRSRSGFSLIELMIALVILAVGLLTLASAQIHAMAGGRSGKHLSQAVTIAQQQMELSQRIAWANLPTSGWSSVGTVDNDIEGPTTMTEQSYAVSQRVTDLVLSQLRSVEVQVAWNEPRRGNRSYTLSSVRFNYEGL
jgi:prepilin-type N-terminal cleavage/methylation domain-containing protein